MTKSRRLSPRERRVNSDLRALQKLVCESDIFDYELIGTSKEVYRVFFRGNGLWKPGSSNKVLLRDTHEVTITLTSVYPRMIPELTWQTPVFHPNISASGVVCLGGYATHWVPGLMLDALCQMLWDMVRFKNFDTESPYNREAAIWTKEQTTYQFPVDSRPLRNQSDCEDTRSGAVSSLEKGLNPGMPEVQFLESTSGMSSPKESQEDKPDSDIVFLE
ncbi:MAG: ubiquitin-conjugating enzyme E2 [Planctomycetota bacterium]|nr:ubiquitin-conjugating enzyme E2 [Planctomycetota bacterium]